MFSPGTIKAIGLMSKGVSSDKAFEAARVIDGEAASARVNFYTEQSLQNYYTGTTPLNVPNSTITPSATTPTPQPSPTNPIVAQKPVSANQVVNKSLSDMITSGEYKRNTGSVLPATGQVPATGSQKKIKTFYDQKFLPTPDDELNQSLSTNKPYINKNLAAGVWGSEKDVQKGIIEKVGQTLSKVSKSPSDFTIATPEQQKQEQINFNQSLGSNKQALSNFFNASNEVDLNKAKSILDKEITKQIEKAELLFAQDTNKLVQDKKLASGAKMDLAYGSSSVKNNRLQELTNLKRDIEDTYRNRQYTFDAQKIVANLKQGVSSSTNVENYLKSLDNYANKAGGLANLGGDFSDIVKRANSEGFLDRPMTEADIQLGGPKVLNEKALELFKQSTVKPLSVADQNDSYHNEVRGFVVDGYLKVGEKVAQLLTNESLSYIKRQTELNKLAQKENITERELKEIEREYNTLSRQIDINQKLVEKTNSIHNYDSLKANKELKNFTGGYIEDLDKLMADSRRNYSQDLGGLEKTWLVTKMTGAKLLSGAGKLVTEFAGGVGTLTGWDALAKTGRLATEYITVNDLVNFDRVNNRGEFQTSNQFAFTDAKGETFYQPSAMLYTGFEAAPLVIATVYGASGISALGGRVLSASRATLVTKGVMSAKRAQQFESALAATNSYSKAFQRTLAQSNSGWVRALGTRASQNIALGGILYPQEFGRTYNELYEKGIPNAREKAHAIAGVTTAIEMITESVFPDLKYLDDFAEKGVFRKQNWVGSAQQYRTLYGDIFGTVFTPKTLEYLAKRSAAKAIEIGGKVGAGGRFMLSRGIQEGFEEVGAEVMNYFADNHMGLAAMRGEPPTELEFNDILNAFTGALIGPPMGIKTQVKSYTENRKFGQMYDIMLNSQYYKDKINKELKAGKINAQQASVALTKIQELETIEQEYGVRNLKNFQDPKRINDITDLMEDSSLQYDYFKNILKAKELETKLSEIEDQDYTDEQKQQLIADAEQATTTINNYKKRADFYGQMTEGDKKQVLDTTLNRKVRLSRFAKTETLEKSEADIDELLAQAKLNKRPAYYTESLERYKDNLTKLKEERERAEQDAIASNNYNPITDALENTTPNTSMGTITNEEEFAEAIAQAMLTPDRGDDLFLFFSGAFDEQIEQLDKDSSLVVEDYLAQLNRGRKTETTTRTNPDGTIEVIPGETDPNNPEITLETLTDEQQEELADMLTSINNQHDDLVQRKNQIDQLLSQGLNQVVPQAIRDIQDPDVKQQALNNWVESLRDNLLIQARAISELMQSEDVDFEQDVFYNRIRFGEFVSENREAIDKRTNEIKESIQKQKDADQVNREEVSLEGLQEETTEETKEETIIVPELLPEDVTETFEGNLARLEMLAQDQEVDVVINEVTGELVTSVDIPKERTKVLNDLLKEIAANRNLKAAQAMMTAVMQTLGKPNSEIKKTLDQMEEVSKNNPVDEVDYTHMFELYQLARMTNQAPPSTQAQQAAAEDIGVTTTDTETKKADIERRRKEEINYRYDTILPDAAEILAEINAKYDAELAALEEVKPVQETKTETKPKRKPTEEQKAQQENQSKVLSTTPLFFPTKGNQIDLPFFNVQDKIVQGLDKEILAKKEVNTALVDLFTIIEEVLGPEVLEKLENIFNEVTTPGVSPQRLKELRKEFAFLFPSGFLKNTALRYIFDDIMIKGVAQTDISEKGKLKLDATDDELLPLNVGRIVSIKTDKGKVYPEASIANKNGVMYYVVKGGKADGKDLWVKLDRTKTTVEGLRYPVLGTRPLQFSDLNTIHFTVLDKDGKVQKYSDDGNRNSDGDKALLFTLPTAKYKATPTPLQEAFNGVRAQLVEGKRVKISTPVLKESKIGGTISIAQEDGTTRVANNDYTYEFVADNLESINVLPTEVNVQEQKNQSTTIAEKTPVTQESSVAAVERMIEASKLIPDPSKEGYLINDKRYERQSGFVKRVLGDNNIETEDSKENMELGAAVGNLLDIIGRDVLGGNKLKSLGEYIEEAERMGKSLRGGKGYSLLFTEVQFQQVVEELTKVKEELNAQGWKLFTEGLIIHREFTEKEKKETGYEGVAGAMDILAVDPEGRVHIIDFKNKKFRTEEKFATSLYSSKGGFPSNVSKWSTQQTTYAILSEDFGLPVDSISILAFASQYSEEGGAITIDGLTLASNKTQVLDKHKSPVSSNLIRLGFDSKIIKQLNIRTATPSTPVVTEAQQKPLDKLQENIPEIPKENIENAFDVLNSLGIDTNDLGFIVPDEGMIDPDALNPPPCT